jgi:hypothetical protein
MRATWMHRQFDGPRLLRCLVAALSLVYGVMFAAKVSAQSVDHAEKLARFVDDDTFFVGYVDVASIPAGEATGEFTHLGVDLPPEVQTRLIGPMILGSLVKQFQEAGGRGLYTVMGLADFNSVGGPVLIATTAVNRDPAEVERMLAGAINDVANDQAHAKLLPVAAKLKTRRVGDAILVGTESVVERYAARVATPRNDFVEPLVRMTDGGASLAAVFSPGPGFRRVVRELWPQFPPPLEKLRGALADHWLRLEFEAKLQSLSAAELTLRTTDTEAAQTFVELVRALPAACEQFNELGDTREHLGRTLQTIVDTVALQLDGTRVVMRLPTDEADLAKLGDLTNQATDAALESTRQRERMQQFKEMSLGMLNFEDAKKHLPAPAIRDANGRPLLSWRIAILPYLEASDAALYKQFHLDEPWDSPHNLALVKQMPDVYADPSYRELAREGKTTYQVPVGPGTIFDTETGVTFRDIVDGSSKTLLIVEVPPEDAVVWTKPDDWQVDMQDPLKGLSRQDRERIVAATSDAAVHTIPVKMEPDVLRAMLTRGGKETFDWP